MARERQKRIPLKFFVQGLYNEPLLVKIVDPEGREAYAQTISFLTPSKGRPMTEDFLKDELSSLGNTVYEIENFDCFIQEGLFLNHRELKELRREIVEKMNKIRVERPARKVMEIEISPMLKTSGQAGLNIVLRSKSQVEGFAKNFSHFLEFKKYIKSVILDFEFGKDYSQGVEMIRSLGIKTGIATTRILKPNEYYNLNTIIRCRPDIILVRNLGALEYLKSKTTISLMGDFSLNVTNSLSLDYLTQKGLETINVSYDLNQDQLLNLIAYSDSSKIEVTLHQYMPEFHMEHCVFAAFLSTGSSFKDCGKPCEKHEVKLKDSYGNMHFLKADQECRNTFFKATPQSAGFLVDQLMEKGVSNYRIEALNETSEEINLKILTYLKLLKGEISPRHAFDSLKVVENYGLGPGQLSKSDKYKDRKRTDSF
jgi:putative protease